MNGMENEAKGIPESVIGGACVGSDISGGQVYDPEQEAVLVYDLEHGDYYPKQYGFKDAIPVIISDGECVIDFSRVLAGIEGW
ncbi:MAG: hypothetical protein Q4A32_12155 [Lachnospiraceae bacterium]|nr:hypothetical protein [Lachnospiraceae bacterium]